MKKQFTLTALLAGTCLAFSGAAQQLPAPAAASPAPASSFGEAAPFIGEGMVYRKKLPDDLPQSKLLFIRYLPVALPPEGPTGWGEQRKIYFLMKNHNKAFPEANEQLVEAAARYPYAHRVTTMDSIFFYREQGYKYMLMQSSFNAAANGTFQGTTGNGSGANRTYSSTSVDLYVQDLSKGDKYIFDGFSETFIYYYKGQVGMLLKKVAKQFAAKK